MALPLIQVKAPGFREPWLPRNAHKAGYHVDAVMQEIAFEERLKKLAAFHKMIRERNKA